MLSAKDIYKTQESGLAFVGTLIYACMLEYLGEHDADLLLQDIGRIVCTEGVALSLIHI